MAHRWNNEDDVALSEAVEACLSMQESMKGSRELWWAAVCGRLGLVDVSPDAARTRWQRLRQRDTSKTAEAWDSVAEQVEEYEQSLLEATADDIADVRRKVNEMHEWFRDVRDGIDHLVCEWDGKTER